MKITKTKAKCDLLTFIPFLMIINSLELSLKLWKLKTKWFSWLFWWFFCLCCSLFTLLSCLNMFASFFICCCVHEFNPSSHVSIPILIVFVLWNLYPYSHLMSIRPCYGWFISPLQIFGFFFFLFLGMWYLGFLF